MITQKTINLTPKARGFHLVTGEIIQRLDSLPDQGILHLFVQHTSAGITINENADPSVRADFSSSFNHLVKENEPFYTHTMEGPDDMPAHIKSALVGVETSIPITNGKLNLGTWQGIYLCEFRNHASSRKIVATIYS
ncbi:MAG: secondary thiamine-phosphate synthase enzyme YjbQ [Bacteriovoracaceae bacterium]|nr:secondary thiamine-phosphate synthase enzyme YjbQ [Bacteriovoracaceae bacterium]